MTDDLNDTFRALHRDVAERVSRRPVAEIARLAARRRHARQSLAAASSAVVVLAVGIGVWASGSVGSKRHDVGPIGPAPSVSASTARPAPATRFGHGGPPTTKGPSVSASPQPNVRSVALPAGYLFNELDVAAGGLYLTGTPASTAPMWTQCVAAPVDPASANLGAVVTGGCPNPAVGAPAVAPVVSDPATDHTTVAIAHTDAATGATTTGPVIMTFSYGSTSRLVTARGGDSLWLYDVDSTKGPEAIEVSATTGKVDDVVPMPQLYRPIVVADASGLWIGNSIDGDEGLATLFHVTSHSTKVTTILPDTDTAVDWLHGSYSSVWAGVRSRGSVDETLWRFDDAGKAIFHVADPDLFVSTVVGDEKDGLWTAFPATSAGAYAWPTGDQLEVVRINADTGAITVEANLPPISSTVAVTGFAGVRQGSIAFVGGAFFMLEPPFHQGGYLGFSILARVTPR